MADPRPKRPGKRIDLNEFYIETLPDKETFELFICDDGPTIVMSTTDLFIIAKTLAKHGYRLVNAGIRAANSTKPSVN